MTGAREVEHTDQLTDKAFERVRRKADGLATRIVRRLNEIIVGMPDVVAPQTLIEFLASALMQRDEQLFRWLLESLAAQKIQEIDDARMNLHLPHPTVN
jgi:hypothetical protein